MATIPSQSSLEIRLCKKACKSCGLDIFQGPALECAKKAQVFWVGLSAVAFEEGEEKLPLSPLTRSGSLIHSVEAPLSSEFSFYKTNLVKCAPLRNEKLRYPDSQEMEKCFPNFQWELEHLRPHTVLLLGKQVADFVLRKLGLPKANFPDDFGYHSYVIGGIKFVPVHHPSFILVYKRKQLEQYIQGLQNIIMTTLKPKRKSSKRKADERLLVA